MPIFVLSEKLVFPPVRLAEPNGMLAVGGDLSVERLLLAYRSGIFPWYSEGDPITWCSPDPRCVLFPDRLRISHSMRQVINKGRFRVTFDKEFRTVMTHCGEVKRRGQDGTWITRDMIEAYWRLHEAGHAHSVEVRERDKLVGGLYGITIGACFTGESMFTLVPNASKFGLIQLTQKLASLGFDLVDCQVPTAHLMSLGAEDIPRTTFLRMLKAATRKSVAWS